MNDLELAKNQLYTKNLTLSITKNGKVIFETSSHKISGFINAIEKFNDQLQGASAADRVAGRAIALLCVYSGIGHVYAEVLSKQAEAVFEENGVCYEWKKKVDNVLDVNKSDVCPFEKLAADISDPEESYPKFKSLLEKMKACR